MSCPLATSSRPARAATSLARAVRRSCSAACESNARTPCKSPRSEPQGCTPFPSDVGFSFRCEFRCWPRSETSVIASMPGNFGPKLIAGDLGLHRTLHAPNRREKQRHHQRQPMMLHLFQTGDRSRLQHARPEGPRPASSESHSKSASRRAWCASRQP